MNIFGSISFNNINNQNFYVSGFKDIFTRQNDRASVTVLSQSKNLKYSLYSNALLIGQENLSDSVNQKLNILYFQQQNNLGEYCLIYIENNIISIIRGWNCKYSLFYYIDNKKLYFSNDIRILKNIVQISFDLIYLQTFLNNNVLSGNTAFLKIFEILPNCCLEFNLYSKLLSKKIFSSFYSDHTQYNAYNAQEEIYEKLKNICKIKTKNFSNIILDYSGGIDSNLLLNILNEIRKETNQNLIPINFFANQFNLSNESKYCKFFCNQYGLPLISLDHNQCLPFAELEAFNLLPKHPSAELVLFKRFDLLNNFAKSVSNVCFINGEGGDHLFSCPPILESLADIIIDKKLSFYFKKLKNLYYFFRIPLIKLLSLSIKNNFNIKSYFNENYTVDWLVNTKTVNKNQNLSFQEVFKDCKLSPGKIIQLISIFQGKNITNLDLRINSFTENIALFHPILEESFIRDVFNIPTYELFDKAYDRFLIRDLLSSKVNSDFIWRKDKGEITGLVQLGFQKNVKITRDICMEGIMVKNNLVDKTKLEKCFKRLITGGEYEEYHNIMNLVGIELFVRSWQMHLNN